MLYQWGKTVTPVALVALKKVVYAGQTYTAGQHFEARDGADATLLKLTKLAKDASVPPVASAPDPQPVPEPALVVEEAALASEPEPEPSDPEVESTPAVSPETEDVAPTRRRGTYKRRDMTAENG